MQEVSTAQTDPRVVYDKNGFRATDAGGHLLFNLDANAGSADFSGHVHAAGLDLDTSPFALAPLNSVIRWLDALGETTSELYGWHGSGAGGGSNLTELYAHPPGPDDTNSSGIELWANVDPTLALAAAKAGLKQKTILRADGTSDYAFSPQFVNLVSAAATGVLGGSFQDVPGLGTGNLALTPGNTVIMIASVRVNISGANSHQVFWSGNGPAGAFNFSANTVATIYNSHVSPIMVYKPAAGQGNYSFKVQAAAPGGGGTAGGATSVAMVIVI